MCEPGDLAGCVSLGTWQGVRAWGLGRVCEPGALAGCVSLGAWQGV